MTEKFDVVCPECSSILRITISDIANQRTVVCPRGHSIRLVDEGGVDDG